jgi:hypothetical protein
MPPSRGREGEPACDFITVLADRGASSSLCTQTVHRALSMAHFAPRLCGSKEAYGITEITFASWRAAM